MLSLGKILLGLFGIGIIILAISFVSLTTQEKIVKLECSPEFWENNLELWKITGINPNSDFDETFGKDYFEPNITLAEAISKKGVGIDHIARTGTAAYLNAILDTQIDEETVRKSVNFGYVHQLDSYLEECKETERKVPVLSW